MVNVPIPQLSAGQLNYVRQWAVSFHYNSSPPLWDIPDIPSHHYLQPVPCVVNAGHGVPFAVPVCCRLAFPGQVSADPNGYEVLDKKRELGGTPVVAWGVQR